VSVYHVELRDFPHNMARFNLDQRGLQAIVEPWARGQKVEFGEHLWNPQEAEITILEGPQIPLGQLSMGRGWRTAERQGKDVTDSVITAVRQAMFAGPGGAQAGGASGPVGTVAAEPALAPRAYTTAGDPLALGMQLATLLGPDAMRLLDAWRAAAAASPGRTPSESLATAEQELRDGAG
jgi:hypothetical protein